ncbi:hypothetical protein FBU59_002109 [Linderina macrospora]|uniref:Uncharacterized protein n=1 Tax=Linderina macrospora TaxID=4868 RepID=A0ACC1JC56_9FUNG|nr:hypothetical protein FBU59_002109 [Linderina macrospora]
MAPADDDDESTNWADFSTFANHVSVPAIAASTNDAEDDDDFGEWHGATTSTTTKATAARSSTGDKDIEKLTEMFQMLKKSPSSKK